MSIDIEKTLDQIRKRYGLGSIQKLNKEVELVESISTSSISLDDALGVKGVPKGRIIEIYGAESTGKTTLCAHIVAEAQKKNELCSYIDMENAVDIAYFNKIGVNTHENFLMSQPSNGEEALGILEMLLESEKVSIVVIDSVAALIPKAELDGEIEDSTIGLQARMMSKAMRRLTSLVNKSNTCVIFINQLRENIQSFGYGPKTTTTGGKALKYYSSVRIELAKIGQIKDGENVIGSRIKAKVIKNKVAAPFKEAEYDLIFGEGISKEREIIEFASKKGIITKGGAWYSYGDVKIGQGLEKASTFLKNNIEIRQEIIDKIYESDINN